MSLGSTSRTLVLRDALDTERTDDVVGYVGAGQPGCGSRSCSNQSISGEILDAA